jgi:O-antigen/teichoic acid export membrane protein
VERAESKDISTKVSEVRPIPTGRDGTLVAANVGSSNVLRARLLSGSMIMLFSSAAVGGINLMYNLIIARWLGAEEFGHAAAVYTLLMLLSSVTLAFQLVCSKFVAQSESLEAKAAVYISLHRRAWQVGIVIGYLLIWASGAVSHYLNLPTRTYIVLLGIGTALYVPLGVRRGLLQGMYEFRRLAENFVVEVLVKLVGAMVLMAAGMEVTGVIAAVVMSLAVAYLLARPPKAVRIATKPYLPASFWEGTQATVFFIGQVIINNVDIVLVKHFFSAAEAGLYAAVALVGRVVYMLSWSVVSSMFPVSAGARSDERGGRTVLTTTFLLVLLITGVFLFGLWVAPNGLWKMVLGTGFPPLGGKSPYTSLLLLYAAATGVYSLAVVLMTYEMSRRIANVGWLQLAVSGTVVVGIYMFHGDLQQVIMVQLVLMIGLVLVVSAPLFRTRLSAAPVATVGYSLRKIQRVSEDEVLSEFLKNEFYEREYDLYREKVGKLVYTPDLSSSRENALRRALLFHRRGQMWRELPSDTEWWEVELSPEDLARIRIFPRSQWRRIAKGSFSLTEVVERLRGRIESGNTNGFFTKIRSLTQRLAEGATFPSVLLIAIDQNSPLTIIEGNHRVAAATLVSPDLALSRFRFLCGFSPRMTECCWYQTDLSSLWRYALFEA